MSFLLNAALPFLFYAKELPPPDAEFYSSSASYHLALRISDDGRGIFVLGQGAFESGSINPSMMTIIFDGVQYLRAADISNVTSITSLGDVPVDVEKREAGAAN